MASKFNSSFTVVKCPPFLVERRMDPLPQPMPQPMEMDLPQVVEQEPMDVDDP